MASSSLTINPGEHYYCCELYKLVQRNNFLYGKSYEARKELYLFSVSAVRNDRTLCSLKLHTHTFLKGAPSQMGLMGLQLQTGLAAFFSGGSRRECFLTWADYRLTAFLYLTDLVSIYKAWPAGQISLTFHYSNIFSLFFNLKDLVIISEPHR